MMTPENLINRAYALHYEKRFSEAIEAYREVIEAYPRERESLWAQRQIENLAAFATAAKPVPQRA